MRRRARGARKVTVSRTIEIDVDIECEVRPGEPEVRWGDNAHPGADPEVEIGRITVTGSNFDLSALIDLGRAEVEAIEESALEIAADDDDDPLGGDGEDD